MLFIFADGKGIVVHFDGSYVSVYLVNFPSEYLDTLRNRDISTRKPKLKLNYTRRYNLFQTTDHTEFIREFVTLLRFVAAGKANVGHLRRDSEVIHRTTIENIRDDVRHAPQQAQDDSEERVWMDLERWRFED